MGWSEVGDTVCPIARALAVVGDRWTVLILRELFLGVKRFEEFQQQTGMSPHLLSTRLKRLEAEGIVVRRPYSERPVRHEYRLTDKGAALFGVIVGLKQWGDRYGAAARSGKPMELVGRTDGRPLDPVLIDAETGQRMELTNVRAVAGPGADQATRAFFERLALTRAGR